MRALLSCLSIILREVDLENVSLVLREILRVFVNTVTADGKYPDQDCENSQLPIQMQSSENEKIFLDFLFHFWNLHQILNILKQWMVVIANAFPKLMTVKNFVRTFSKKHRFRQRFDSEHVKASQILAKYPLEHFYQDFS